MSLTKKVAYSTIVQVAGKAVTTATSLVIIGILTRSLGVSGFGQFTSVFAYVNFVAILVDLGFFTILVREIVYARHPLDKIVNNILTFRASLALVVYALAFLIAQFLPYEPIVKAGIGFAAMAVFWLSLNSTIIALFQSHYRIDKGVLTDVIGRLIILGCILYLSHQSAHIYLIFFAYVIGNFINFVLNIIFASKYVKIRPAFDLAFWKSISKEAIPMGILLILGYIYFKIDMVILSVLRPNYDVGIYGVSYKILEIVLTLSGMYMGAVFPIITHYIDTKNERIKDTIQKSFDFLSLLAWPMVVGTILLARPLIKVIGGEEFVDASAVSWRQYAINPPIILSILIFAAGLSYISTLFGNIVIAMKKQRSLILPNLIIVIFNILLNIIFIRYWSYLAAAAITVLSETLALYFSIKIYRQSEPFLPNLRNFLKYFFSALVMAVFLYIFKGNNLFLLIFVSILIYAIMTIITGGVNLNIVNQMFKLQEQDENSN